MRWHSARAKPDAPPTQLEAAGRCFYIFGNYGTYSAHSDSNGHCNVAISRTVVSEELCAWGRENRPSSSFETSTITATTSAWKVYRTARTNLQRTGASQRLLPTIETTDEGCTYICSYIAPTRRVCRMVVWFLMSCRFAPLPTLQTTCAMSTVLEGQGSRGVLGIGPCFGD